MESIIDISRNFFNEIVKPILEREFPEETGQMTFGVWGLGSEALKLDDELSRDHHWGIRIDTLMPQDIFTNKREEILRVVGAKLPATYQGHELQEGIVAGAGLIPDSLEGFLTRSIGIDHPPQNYAEWLNVPEEDIIHIINGEVWHDPAGRFTAVRQSFSQYYPEPVRLRRIAHWCRYFSGMGTYALKRAILRNNQYYAATAFGKAIRWGLQLAFMLEKQYYPYDKWIMTYFKRLPRLYEPLRLLVDEAVEIGTPWERKLELLDRMADVLDQTMVADGIIPPHPPFAGSASSGYRLMEHAYAEILKQLPEDIRNIIPLWDQVFLERFVVDYVANLDRPTWHAALNLTPRLEKTPEEKAE